MQFDDEQIKDIAEAAALAAIKKAKEELYVEIGKTVLNKVLWAVGVLVVVLALWLGGHKL
jgi:hypothetical protein